MHDPLVVAHEIPSPIPHRKRWKDQAGYARRWGFARPRRTNVENLGEPVYPWWRACGWTLYLAGRAFGFGTLATIWHVEPGGRDSGEVCKHWADGKPKRAWKWHVHHWRIRVPWWHHRLHRFLFERCGKCGHRFPWGYAPVSHGWDAPQPKHWWSIDRHGFHHECSSVISYKRTVEERDDLIRSLVAELRFHTDESEPQLIKRLHKANTARGPEWKDRWRTLYALEKVLGYERDDNHDLVKDAS